MQLFVFVLLALSSLCYIAAVTHPPLGKDRDFGVQRKSSTKVMTGIGDNSKTAKQYDCKKHTVWTRQCKIYDFAAANCFPWDVSACPPPAVMNKFAPCPQYHCKVIV